MSCCIWTVLELLFFTHSYKKAVKSMLLTKENWNFQPLICRLFVTIRSNCCSWSTCLCNSVMWTWCVFVSIYESHSLIVRIDYANFSCTCLLFAPLFLYCLFSYSLPSHVIVIVKYNRINRRPNKCVTSESLIVTWNVLLLYVYCMSCTMWQ